MWLSAVLAFGVMVEGYSQALHPVALLGARACRQNQQQQAANRAAMAKSGSKSGH